MSRYPYTSTEELIASYLDLCVITDDQLKIGIADGARQARLANMRDELVCRGVDVTQLLRDLVTAYRNPHCLNDGVPCAPNGEGGCVACDFVTK
jgi:hypothetical protein